MRPGPELRPIIAADCPRMIAGHIHDVCGIHFPQMSKLPPEPEPFTTCQSAGRRPQNQFGRSRRAAIYILVMDQQDDDELVAEAGGGGNRLPPPPDVTCGETPERRDDWERRRRELIRQQRAAMLAAALRQKNELRRRIREIHNSRLSKPSGESTHDPA